MAHANERLHEHFLAKKPLGGILSDDALERVYRQAIRLRTEEVLKYLSEPEVADDFLAALVLEGPLLCRLSRLLPFRNMLISSY